MKGGKRNEGREEDGRERKRRTGGKRNERRADRGEKEEGREFSLEEQVMSGM